MSEHERTVAVQLPAKITGIQPELAQAVAEGNLPDGTRYDVAVGLQSKALKLTIGPTQVRFDLEGVLAAAVCARDAVQAAGETAAWQATKAAHGYSLEDEVVVGGRSLFGTDGVALVRGGEVVCVLDEVDGDRLLFALDAVSSAPVPEGVVAPVERPRLNRAVHFAPAAEPAAPLRPRDPRTMGLLAGLVDGFGADPEDLDGQAVAGVLRAAIARLEALEAATLFWQPGPLPDPAVGLRALVERRDGSFEAIEVFDDGVWSAQAGHEVRTVGRGFAVRFALLPAVGEVTRG